MSRIMKSLAIAGTVCFSNAAPGTGQCYNLQGTTCCATTIQNDGGLCRACEPGGQCCPYVFDTNTPYNKLADYQTCGWASAGSFPPHTSAIACDFHHVECISTPPYCKSKTTHELRYCIGVDPPVVRPDCGPLPCP